MKNAFLLFTLFSTLSYGGVRNEYAKVCKTVFKKLSRQKTTCRLYKKEYRESLSCKEEFISTCIHGLLGRLREVSTDIFIEYLNNQDIIEDSERSEAMDFLLRILNLKLSGKQSKIYPVVALLKSQKNGTLCYKEKVYKVNSDGSENPQWAEKYDKCMQKAFEAMKVTIDLSNVHRFENFNEYRQFLGTLYK